MSKKEETKENTTPNILEIFQDNPDGLANYFKILEENEEKRNKALEKVNEYNFSNAKLTQTAQPLTRKEMKKLKKAGFKISEVDTFDEDRLDEFLDELLALKGITEDDADGMNYHELKLWGQQIVIRTLNPLKFEGND